VRLPKFEYVEPKSIEEACSILSDESSAKILAGGTDLLANMKHRVEVPSVLANIKRISGLDFIRQDNGAIRIGALTPLKRLYKTTLVTEKVPALSSAAASVGSYHHQTMGTLGGNLCQQNRCKYFNQSQWWRSAREPCFKAGGGICHVVNKKEICYSSYCGDMAPILLVMNAKVVLANKGDSREISLQSLFSGDGKTPLDTKKGEILTEIVIPEEALNSFSTYSKFANRESIDFPIVGAAIWSSVQRKEHRVSFTAVDRKPIRARNIESVLKGRDLSEEIVEEVAGLASKEAALVKSSNYAPSYKRRLMEGLLRSTLKEAMRRS
jgi:4-hydroxybenzoyl-CoA reductase beta subunit|tara:strand:- start:130627 stop:131598 length:972 start_codon:yes stop_codon:yes gene_type:complete